MATKNTYKDKMQPLTKRLELQRHETNKSTQ